MSGQVRYVDPRPSPMAEMLGGLIQANLAAHPERARLLGSPALYSIESTDAETAVAIRISCGRVAVGARLAAHPHIRISADSDTLISLPAVPLRLGFPDPMTKEGRGIGARLLSRRLVVRGAFLHPEKLIRLNRLLSVREGG